MAVNNSESTAWFDRALNALPGGVSSPVRAFRAVGGAPLFVDHAKGAHFEDLDGTRYLDFVCSWGPLILGHAHPGVLEAVQRAARDAGFGVIGLVDHDVLLSGAEAVLDRGVAAILT